MPGLAKSIVEDLAGRLREYLSTGTQLSEPVYLTAGGSAAVFKVETATGIRAIKVFDPKFLEGPSAPAERRRLELQRKLVGHSCPNLVDSFAVEEALGTASSRWNMYPSGITSEDSG